MYCKKCGFNLKDGVRFCPKCGQSVEDKILPQKNFQTELDAVWPEWKVIERLGKGSHGTVYKAVRNKNGVESFAAIKVIRIPSDESEIIGLKAEGLNDSDIHQYYKNVVNDFVNEISIMESLKGVQNIVNIEDFTVVQNSDSIGWNIFIRMELLTQFEAYIYNKKLSEKDIIKFGIDICTALEICSKRNIIHRDIKPENIFVNDFGHVKLGDFGIAKRLDDLSGDLSQKGTFNYMAPEIAHSTTYDIRADIYSLGIVLYRLLNNNKLPFFDINRPHLNSSERRTAVERRLTGEKLPAPCNASPEVANIVLCACSFDPNKRFSSATAMKNALLAAYNEKNSASVHSTSNSTNNVKDKKLLVVTLALLSIVAVLAIVLVIVNNNNKNEVIVLDNSDSVSAYSETTSTVSASDYECPEIFSQKIVVTATEGSTDATVQLYVWEKGEWQSKFICKAVVGKNGIGLDYGEGKGITPQGVFKLGIALSSGQINNPSWPLKIVDSDTCIVDDSSSKYYNTITNISFLSDGVHYDPIGRTILDGYTDVCIYIEHNGNGLTNEGVVHKKGSAITICGKDNLPKSTYGCIDIYSGDMNVILGLLDYSKNPHIEIVVQ